MTFDLPVSAVVNGSITPSALRQPVDMY